MEAIQDVTKMMIVRKRFPNEFYMIRESDMFEFSKNRRAETEFQDVMNRAELPAGKVYNILCPFTYIKP